MTVRIPRRAVVTALGAAALLAAAQSGCVTEGPPPKPKPQPAPEQPAGLTPDRILPMAGQVMADTDRNGYVDSLSLTVYLFARGYDPAISGDGSFEFELRGPDGEAIHTWVVDAAEARASIKSYPPGPAYQFDLNLLDRAGGDELARQRAELWSRFIPASGAPIESRSPLTLTLGPAPGAGR